MSILIVFNQKQVRTKSELEELKSSINYEVLKKLLNDLLAIKEQIEDVKNEIENNQEEHKEIKKELQKFNTTQHEQMTKVNNEIWYILKEIQEIKDELHNIHTTTTHTTTAKISRGFLLTSQHLVQILCLTQQRIFYRVVS